MNGEEECGGFMEYSGEAVKSSGHGPWAIAKSPIERTCSSVSAEPEYAEDNVTVTIV